MKALISTGGIHQSFDGDVRDVSQRVAEEVRHLTLAGRSATVVVQCDPLWCSHCEEWRPTSEPRRNQPTRVERGYFECAVCGYVIEGVVP